MKNIISRFNKIAEANPDQFAVVSTNGSLTYEALNHHSQMLSEIFNENFNARYGRSILSTDVIGIALGKEVNLYVALLAILKTGASYVPLDPDVDLVTRAHIIETCNCKLILASDETIHWSSNSAYSINLSSISYDANACISAFPADKKITENETAVVYTIFTSGSTGKPKGVIVNNSNIINLVDWCISQFNLNVKTKTLQFSTINFDASILDIFPTWLAGGTLFIPSSEQRMSITALTNLCNTWEINHVFLPPSLLNAMDASRFPTIKTLLTGGEPCTPEVIKNWSYERQLYNLYGPTECTVMACFKLMGNATNPKNIGVPMNGVETYILDKDYKIANEGELFIAGNGVALGYRGQENITKEKFISLPELTTGKIYRTGDLVRQDKNGDIIFLGRIDRQVKIRGYRIEPEEIEGALLLAGCISAAVKLTQQNTIVAYVVTGNLVCTDELKQKLSTHLSPYKIPQHIVRMNSLPLKNNGKIDYQSLPEPVIEINSLNGASQLSAEELMVAKLWAQILEIDLSLIEPDSNFRDLGGDSITIAMLLAKLEDEFNVSIDFIDFFENSTIKFISETLNNEESQVC